LTFAGFGGARPLLIRILRALAGAAARSKSTAEAK
jgi:hypothetical protein